MEDVCTGSSIMSSVMCDFKDCVNNIEVVDINSTGIHFTWNQKPKGRDGILKKLDRIMENMTSLIPSRAEQRSRIDVVRTMDNVEVTGTSVPEVTNDEKQVMFDIGDDNAPGPDVYSSAFFKKGWDVLRTDVCTAIQDFFSNDDLFIFTYGDVNSAKVIIDSFDEFKRVSGLIPSISKSTAFFCNVLNQIKLAILNIMPFAEGKLLVKYLGVPLISSRLLNRDCKVLVEKALLVHSYSIVEDIPAAHLRSVSFVQRCFTPRDITREGFSITSCVADLVSNGGWNWPQAWLLKAPNLVTIPAPNLVNARNHTMKWCDTNVWFSQAILRHAFHLWLIMRRSLKRDDKPKTLEIDPIH
ncbi:hypothetical protein Tco_0795330 [Tanacetum coccineum]